MATESHRAVVSFSIFVLIAVIMPILRHGSCVEADKQKHLGLKHKGTVKTIKMEPSSYPNGMNKMEDFPPELIQDWRKNGECPEGTIPILRIRTHRRSPPVHLHGRQLNHSFAGPVVLHQDSNNGNWWLSLQGFAIGYWPGSIVPGLGNGANAVHWGGEITGCIGVERLPAQDRIITQPPKWEVAIFHLKVLENQLASNPKCYDLNYQGNTGTNFGSHFYYGGPGYSAQCP
ncbi:NEP-interacting protein, putative [Actinidia rufa]|uniref:NEP-interacting protein, putative n=1 Tax=Actinidia rufa TaxID=165716 RepID=A0A7J0GLR0_9ERIC|nr:NEP-interacting protein, putative [Actinidia rufa]